MSSVGVNIINRLKEEAKRITKPEQILSKGLTQPFNSMNSAPRKVIYSSEQDQIITILGNEPPYTQTGYEDLVAKECSSYKIADTDYYVLAKISKYPQLPNHHYILLLKEKDTGYHHIIERVVGEHITETYGYLNNNDYLDSLDVSSSIPLDTLYSTSTNFSPHNNRQDGVNLNTAYLALSDNTEDGMVISQPAAYKMRSPLFKKVVTVINDNDIPLNLYGDNEIYKSFPNVGEYVKDGILCAIRRETKDESLFSLSWDKLREILISDEKYTPKDGKVIDVNIHCNNPETLENSAYNLQLKEIYDNQMRYSREIVDSLDYIVNDTRYGKSYELSNLYLHHKKVVDGKKWLNKYNKPFSNIQLEFMVLDIKQLEVGDKVTDRYGGKGVISKILPEDRMPLMDNGERLEFIINPRGPVSRENPGQLIELTINFISRQIIDRGEVLHDSDDFIQLYLDFLKILVPEQHDYMEGILSTCTDEQKYELILSMNGGIVTSIEPISSNIDIDKLSEIYDKFNWMSPVKLEIPMEGSDGRIRHVQSRRYITSAKKYLYRLKQYSEDKSSMTSLSPTNLKNEPSKSKSSSEFRTPYPKTPVKFGVMETGDMLHFLDIYSVVNNLMIHSTAPLARRDAGEELLTGDPFNIDVRIKENAVNRNVEILNTYLKTIGIKLVFEKKQTPLPSAILGIPFKGANEPINGYDSAMLGIPFNSANEPINGYESAIVSFNNLPSAINDTLPTAILVASDNNDDKYTEVPYPSAMSFIK